MSGRRRSPDNPAEWLARAKSSLALASAKTPGVLYEDLCFQIQQAAEKALKAVFVARKIPYPYITISTPFSRDLNSTASQFLNRYGMLSPLPRMLQIRGTREPQLR
ncbi:MAG: HEPN domain-containing protein [Methanoregula sp.]